MTSHCGHYPQSRVMRNNSQGDKELFPQKKFIHWEDTLRLQFPKLVRFQSFSFSWCSQLTSSAPSHRSYLLLLALTIWTWRAYGSRAIARWRWWARRTSRGLAWRADIFILRASDSWANTRTALLARWTPWAPNCKDSHEYYKTTKYQKWKKSRAPRKKYHISLYLPYK